MPLGASPTQGHVLDTEMWEHTVTLPPFRIANTPVCNQDFAEFLNAGGYRTRSLWNKDDWNWRRRQNIETPLYWKKLDGVWHEKHNGSWCPIRPWYPICNINLHEARAFCRFANRRLPSEAEWEMAASWNPQTKTKNIFPWGNSQAPFAQLQAGDTADVRAFPEGDSALGCRQMLGNVWEWTSDKLHPYPGYKPGPYADYSAPYLGKKPVLRGGSWATAPALIRNTWRNFFIKHRRNIFAGLRTCALEK